MLKLFGLLAWGIAIVANVRAILTLARRDWRSTRTASETRARTTRNTLIVTPFAAAVIPIAQPSLQETTLEMVTSAVVAAVAWSILPLIAYVKVRDHVEQLRSKTTGARPPST